MAKILLIEDDATYAGVVSDYLNTERHQVDLAQSVEDATAFMDVYQYQVLIVDWHLPDQDGPSLIRTLRKRGFATPIIMLTGRETIADKEQGFSAGADDYLAKSADPKELIFRVEALLRRQPIYVADRIKIRDIEVDAVNRKVYKKSVAVHLQPQEFDLLEFLIRYSNRVFSAEELLDRLWPSDTEATIHTVRSHINKIRTKLDDENESSLIMTRYKAGYQINMEPN